MSATAVCLAAALSSAPGLSGSQRLEVEAALAALPERMRAGLTLERRADPACADADPFEAVAVEPVSGRVGLCAEGDGPSLRLQVLVAAFLIWDERAGWSREPAWRRYNGWSRALSSSWRWAAKNVDPLAHAAAAGARSPAWDLATFAASWMAARTFPAMAPGADGALECRLLPQATFLHERLRDLASLPPALRPPPRCQAFEIWAQRERLERIEIALATPSTVTVASMFGHVFLRLVSRTGTDDWATLEDRTLAFLVESTLPLSLEPFFAVKGIAGAYEATLVERSFLETYRSYLVMEGRDLRRFQLHLSRAETEALLQRLWSLRQAGRYRYFFFGTNCATLMVDLINSVLPDHRQVRFPEALATTPAGTLEGYAQAQAAAGSPLLTFIPDTLLSFEHEARLAAAGRQRLARRLREVVSRPEQTRLDAWWSDILRGSPEVRAAAYRGLASLDAQAGGSGDDLRGLLRQSAIVETHLQTLANLDEEKALAERLIERRSIALAEVRRRLAGSPATDSTCVALLRTSLTETAQEDRAERLRGYARLRELLEGSCATDADLGDDLRRLALLESENRADDPAMESGLREALFFPEPSRTLGEQRFARGLTELIDYPFVTRVSPALRAILQASAALNRYRRSTRSPERIRQQEIASRRQAEATTYRRAVPRTGIDELEVGAGWDRSPGGLRDGLLLLGGALHDERIGDQRRFGFPSHTALTVLRTQTAWGWSRADSWRRVPAWQARLVGYRSVPPRLAGSPGGPRLGGEVFADLRGRARMGRSTEARLGGGWIWPVLASPDLADHLMLSAGLLATFDRTARAVWGGGPAAGIEGRLGLDRENRGAWLAAHASIRPLFTTAGTVREMAAGGELRLPLAEWVNGSRGIGLRLRATLLGSTLSMPAWDRQLGLTLAFE